jgi:asparagine synthase (glutamine-hydrolysing)
MKDPRELLQAALDIGPFRTAFRLAWEVDRRSGLKRLRQPAAHVPMPSDVPSWDEWWERVPQDCWLRDLPIDPATTETLERAEAARGGCIRLFGGWEAEVGAPPDWHLEPHSGRRWPSRAHWTEAIDGAAGDPRITWELNRFLHVWDWIRAYRTEPDQTWADAFVEHLESWAKTNPFRAGINWASGQELAVRVVSWLAAAATFGPHLGDSFRTLVELCYWHGVHIDAELGFAQHAVPNNHLLAEATALATLGTLFGGWRESDEWRRRGLSLLRAAIDEQFRDDGGYCQSSHTYHRFALEWLLFADGMFELSDHLDDVFTRSLRYFDGLVVGDGELPNFGPNDGARLWRGSDADERDFRPLIDALRARTTSSSVEASSHSFASSGLHVLRCGDTVVWLRAGRAPRRGGHADQLHLDVWHDGRWVAVDAGSYSYAGPEHSWFAGSKSHNGITVEEEGQQQLAGQFTWLGDADARLTEWDPGRRRTVAVSDAWSHLEMRWEREVAVVGDEVRVIDRVTPTRRGVHNRGVRLHWLLDVEVAELEVRREEARWRLDWGAAAIELSVRAAVGGLRDHSVRIVESSQSWRYGEKRPAASVVCEATARGVEFETRFLLR